MTSADITSGLPESHTIPRQWIVTGGRVLLALTLVGAWEWGARAFGPLEIEVPQKRRPEVS